VHIKIPSAQRGEPKARRRPKPEEKAPRIPGVISSGTEMLFPFSSQRVVCEKMCDSGAEKMA